MFSEMNRTLPSAIPAWNPPGFSPNKPLIGFSLLGAKSAGFVQITADSSGTSTTAIVFDKPSRMLPNVAPSLFPGAGRTKMPSAPPTPR